MKNLLLFITLAVLSSFSLFSQGTFQEKADKYFDSYSYAEAINKYEKITDKNISAKRNLASSYLRVGDYSQAESYFAQVANSPEVIPEDMFTLASVYRINKKYELADEWMEKFHQSNPEDKRGELNFKNQGKYKDFLKNEGLFIIRNLAINTKYEDFGTSFFKNKVVFASSRVSTTSLKKEWNWNNLPYLNVFMADRQENFEMIDVDGFSPVKNKKYHEGPAAFNLAGDYMVLTRNNYKGKSADDVVKLQLFYAQLIDGKWSDFLPMPFNSNEYSVGHASLSGDGKTMYFSSDMRGGKGGVDIYSSTLNDNGEWTQPINMGDAINTEGDEMFPSVHTNGMLFFASNGHPGLGGLDVFKSKLDKNEATEVENLGSPINSNKDDFSFILNEEQTNGYFSSNRDGGKGEDDIYAFRMTKPFGVGKIIKGIAKDKEGNILAETDVVLLQSNGKGVGFVMTDKDGKFEFEANADKDYFILGSKDDYVDKMTYVDTYSSEQTIEKDVILEKPANFSLLVKVVDIKTGKPLSGVRVFVANNKTKNDEIYTTSKNGTFIKGIVDGKINERVSFDITYSKSEYMSKTQTFNNQLTRTGEYKIVAEIGKLEVGADIGKIINVQPIYFDYNKFNIRSDARVELDKIVAVMNEYPNMEVELGSHTDCRGKKSYNENLSNKRAKASANYIKSKITNPERIYGKGYGETILINKCECEGARKVPCTDEEHQENRRTEFKVISME